MTVIDAKMAEPGTWPRAPALWTSHLLVGAALLISAAVHMALLGAILFARASAINAPPVKSITVDLVPEKQVPSAVKPQSSKPKPAALDLPKQEAPRQPKPTHTSTPKSERPKTAATRQPAPKQPEQHTAAAQPPPPARQPRAPAKDALATDADAAAARIARMLHLSELDPAVTFEAPPAKHKARLSRAEVAAFKAQLQKCWTPPPGVSRAENVKVVLRVALNPKGTLSKAPVLLAGSPSVHGPALFKSAMQALSQCQPYKMFAARKFSEWKLLDLSFTPDTILDISSGAGFGTSRVAR